jgi:thymidylate synthase
MNTLDKKYQDLLQDILDNGVQKSDRTGTGTISVFGRQIRHNMKQGFPALTTKKLAWKQVVSELLWFLTGQTNISFLLKHNNHILDGDVYKNYTRKLSEKHSIHYKPMEMKEFIERIKTDDVFAKEWGDLGPIYGRQWRKWTRYYNSPVDQIDDLVRNLKENPDSRRLMVSAWNVGELDMMVLPPCHYGFQIYTRELSIEERWMTRLSHYKSDEPIPWDRMAFPSHSFLDKFNLPKRAISLMWNQRSVDTFLGLPFNIASYGLLLEIIAKEVNMVPDELIGNLGDVHLYKNHIEQAKEQMYRRPYDLPKVQITERNWYQHELVKEHLGEKTFDQKIMSYRPDCFELVGYQSHEKIKAPLSN